MRVSAIPELPTSPGRRSSSYRSTGSGSGIVWKDDSQVCDSRVDRQYLERWFPGCKKNVGVCAIGELKKALENDEKLLTIRALSKQVTMWSYAA